MNCKNFWSRLCVLLRERRGEYIATENGKHHYLIDGVQYLVSVGFRENAPLTATDKVARLIDREVEKCLDAQNDSK